MQLEGGSDGIYSSARVQMKCADGDSCCYRTARYSVKQVNTLRELF